MMMDRRMRVEPARKGHPRGPLAFVVVGAFSLCFFAVQADSERFGTCLHYGWVEVVVKVVKVVMPETWAPKCISPPSTSL